MMHLLRLALPLLCAVLISACGSSATPATPPALPNQLHATLVASDYNSLVHQLYVSYFGRPPDAGGLTNFKSQLAALGAPNDIQALSSAYASSAALRALIDSFGTSDESKALYSGDTSAFVTAIYQNVLSRAPDAGGKAFWAGAIDSGDLTRANASLAIMAGALSNTSTQGLADGALIRNRIAVSIYFSDQLTGANATAYSGNTAAASARAMLGQVTANTDPVAFHSTVDTTLAAMQPTTTSLYTPVPAIIKARCAGCHSAHNTIPGFLFAQAGITLDTSAQIHAEAGTIYQVSVLTRTMPYQNQTGMTDAERAILAAWIEGGAP